MPQPGSTRQSWSSLWHWSSTPKIDFRIGSRRDEKRIINDVRLSNSTPTPRMKKVLFSALVALLLVSCGSDPPPDGEIIQVDSDDSEMNAAMERARGSIDEFLEERSRRSDDFTGLLKVYFQDRREGSDDGEHMWVSVESIDDGRFNGTLLSSPGWLKGVKQGDIVEFETSDVTDWIYAKNGKAKGAYTVRVLRSRMSALEREQHDAGYPFSFD